MHALIFKLILVYRNRLKVQILYSM